MCGMCLKHGVVDDRMVPTHPLGGDVLDGSKCAEKVKGDLKGISMDGLILNRFERSCGVMDNTLMVVDCNGWRSVITLITLITLGRDGSD